MKNFIALFAAIFSAALGLLAGLEIIRLLNGPKTRYIDVD